MGRVRLALAIGLWGLAAAVSGETLRVLSAAPGGRLEGDEPQRVQIVFSAPVVALGEVQPLAAPPNWLSVEPPMLARWRWAGTAELVGEPLAPLPMATTFRLAISRELRGIGGERLAAPYAWSFTTPPPRCEIMRGDVDEDGEALAFAVTLRCNQRVDPASLAGVLEVRIEPRPLPDTSALVPAAEIERWEREQPAYAEAWRRLLEAARGAAPGRPPYRIEPDAERPQQVFHLKPEGGWPRSATLHVRVGAGLRSLEGPEPSVQATERGFRTPWPFVPRRFTGRAGAGDQGFDPHSVELELSTPATWKDLAPHLRYRTKGQDRWRQMSEPADAWWWDWSSTDLRLSVLGLGGGRKSRRVSAPRLPTRWGRSWGSSGAARCAPGTGRRTSTSWKATAWWSGTVPTCCRCAASTCKATACSSGG